MRKLILASSLLLMAELPGASQDKRSSAADTALLNDVASSGAGMLNLGCLNALIAIGRTDLTGIFSFVPEKDSAAAMADFLVRNKPAMRKYLLKLNKDLKDTTGIAVWDHEVVMRVLELYASPLAETLEKPATDAAKKLSVLSMAPTLSLEEMTGRRRR